MKAAMATGIVFEKGIPFPSPVTVRIEKTGDFKTLSLSDDNAAFIEVVVTPEIKRLLKELIR